MLILAALASGVAGSLPSQSVDWMVGAHAVDYQAKISTATGIGPKGAKRLTIGNGLVSRSFMLLEDGGVCTIEYTNVASSQTFFRGLSPEANATFSGRDYDIGGCTGVPPSHFEFWNPDIYGGMLATNPQAFKLKNVTQSLPQKPFEWEPGHRNSPKNIAWPPKGVTLSFYYEHPAIASSAQLVGSWDGTAGQKVSTYLTVTATAPQPARLYSFEVAAAFSQYQPLIAELEFKVGAEWIKNAGTKAASIVKGSSGWVPAGLGAGGEAWRAVDGNVSTVWDAQKGAASTLTGHTDFSLTIDFGKAVVVEAIRVTTSGDTVHDPKQLALYAAVPSPPLPLEVAVHYEMYDGLPALRKWVTVHHTGGSGSGSGTDASASTVTIDTLNMELLRAPNFAPERMTVQLVQANNPTPFDQQVAPDLEASFPGRTQQMWFTDPNYDQCCDQELHVTYTLYTFLVLGYGVSTTYGGTTGPGALLYPGDTFESVGVREIIHDSNEQIRQGLAIRKTHAVLAPHLLENPLNFMITDISSTAAWRTAIDQAAESGHDLVIVGFGAAGYCGLCFGQLGNATWVAWFKEQVAYAKSKGVESSAYTLMQHNGWGENTPLAEQTLSRDGKTRGPTACFATDYHAKYRQGVLDFINETGMGGLETDGQYESIPCSDTTGDHHHNGIAGGYSYGMKKARDFNRDLKALGVFQTGADAYFWSGANRWNHADTDAFGHLPLWEQHLVGRMYVYDSVLSRLRSSGQIGVNDLAATTKAACTGGVGGRGRMLCFDVVLAGLYGWGVMPGFRAARLYDPADPDAQAIVATVKGWTSFYREYTKMRPSGAPGILLSDMVHIRRPDSRGIEAVVSVSADTSAAARAIFSVLNPTLSTVLAANVSVPLYYAGLKPGTAVTVTILTPGHNNACGLLNKAAVQSARYVVGADAGGDIYAIVVNLALQPSSYAILLISTATTTA